MRIAVRLDDITPDMDWAKFEKVKGMLDEAGICPLVGIVPDSRDPNLHRQSEHTDFWEYFAELTGRGGWTAAQHGYQHIYTTDKGGLFPLNDFSEFAGISYERQLEMIENGRQIMTAHGIKTDIFMTPAHSYDRNTLKAMKECGFRYVTDGFGNCPYMRDGLIFLPIPFRMADSLKRADGYTTMVLHANTMNEDDMARLGERLAMYTGKAFDAGEVRNCFIDYRELLDVHHTVRKPMQNAGEYLSARLKHRLVSLGRH